MYHCRTIAFSKGAIDSTQFNSIQFNLIQLTRYADSVVAFEVALGAFPLGAIHLIGSVATLGLAVANPSLWNASVAVGTPEPVGAAFGPVFA